MVDMRLLKVEEDDISSKKIKLPVNRERDHQSDDMCHFSCTHWFDFFLIPTDRYNMNM